MQLVTLHSAFVWTKAALPTLFQTVTAHGPVDTSTSKVCKPAILLLLKLKGIAFLNSQDYHLLSFLRKESRIKCNFCLSPFVASTQYSCQYVQYCLLTECTVATDVKSMSKNRSNFFLWNLSSRFHFLARSQNFKTPLLASPEPSAGNLQAPTGRIFMKFNIEVFFENLSRKFKFH